MCHLVEIKRDAVPSNIRIEFERDASLRAVEILVINHDHNGNEVQAVNMIAQDSGKFYRVSGAIDMIDGIDVVA